MASGWGGKEGLVKNCFVGGAGVIVWVRAGGQVHDGGGVGNCLET